MRILVALFVALCGCAPEAPLPSDDAGQSDARSDASASPIVGTWVRSHALRSGDDAGPINGTVSARVTFDASGAFVSSVVVSVEGCERASESGRGTWRTMGDDVFAFGDYVCTSIASQCPRVVEVPYCSGHGSMRLGADGLRYGVRGDVLTLYDRALNRWEYTRE